MCNPKWFHTDFYFDSYSESQCLVIHSCPGKHWPPERTKWEI